MSEDDEFQIAWAHDILDIEKILELTESCNKDCASCSRVEKMDCHLEMREAVHSLSILFKKAILSFVDAAQHALPETPRPPAEKMYS